MNIITNFVTDYGFHIIATAITGILSYIGVNIKNTLKQYYQHKLEKEEAEMVYHEIEELYPNLTKEEKIQKMVTVLGQILKEKKIQVTNLELQILIESTIHKTTSPKDTNNNLSWIKNKVKKEFFWSSFFIFSLL